MQTIQLEVKDDYIDKILDFLKLLPENVAKIEMINRNLEINEKHCIKTVNKIKSGNSKDFKSINDIDRYIEELRNDIS